MDYIAVSVLTTTEGADAVSQMLIDAGSAGTQIEDREDVRLNQRPEGRWDIIDPAIAERMGEDVRVTGYFEADGGAQAAVEAVRARAEALRRTDLGIDMGKLTVSAAPLAGEDWGEAWKRHYRPLRLGEHTVVAPSWAAPELGPSDRRIEIDPGLAFGTGAHETTALCVALIERYLRPGDRVIDVGTGTGILAIAAKLWGASSVLATDIDPVAVRVADENIRANGLAGQIRARQGDLLRTVDEVCDVLIANIIADAILEILSPVQRHIAPGGLFIASGIALDRKDEVLRALAAAGYREIDARDAGEWCAVACRR